MRLEKWRQRYKHSQRTSLIQAHLFPIPARSAYCSAVQRIRLKRFTSVFLVARPLFSRVILTFWPAGPKINTGARWLFKFFMCTKLGNFSFKSWSLYDLSHTERHTSRQTDRHRDSRRAVLYNIILVPIGADFAFEMPGNKVQMNCMQDHGPLEKNQFVRIG